jgi:hypothetical protein
MLSEEEPMARKPTDIVPLQVRLPEGMRKELVNAAEKSQRSLNSEIVWRLGQSLDADARALVEFQLWREGRDQEFMDRLMSDPERWGKIQRRVGEAIAAKKAKRDA